MGIGGFMKKLSFAELMDAKKDWLEALSQPDTRPFVKCKTCGKDYKREGAIRFYGRLEDDGNCYDCFCEKLKTRKLTKKEIESLAKDYIEKRDAEYEKKGLYARRVSLSEIFNKEQCEEVFKRVDELDEEKRQAETERIRKEYRQQILDIAKRLGYDKDDFKSSFIDLLAEILKEVDDRIEKKVNSVRPAIFR